jgi:hypothetical protein
MWQTFQFFLACLASTIRSRKVLNYEPKIFSRVDNLWDGFLYLLGLELGRLLLEELPSLQGNARSWDSPYLKVAISFLGHVNAFGPITRQNHTCAISRNLIRHTIQLCIVRHQSSFDTNHVGVRVSCESPASWPQTRVPPRIRAKAGGRVEIFGVC